MMTEFVPFNMVNTASMRRPLSDQQETCELFFCNADVESAYARLLLCVCPICGHQMPSMPALNRHTSNEHNLSYCELCIKHARLLPSEFLPMTKEALAKHVFYDSKKKTGHPPCNFCNRERFYEFEDLIKHIKETHFMCDICSYSGLFEVFRQQSELFEHYESSHFVCEVCKKQDVVSYFESSDELGLHKLTKHGDQSWNPIRVESKSTHRARQHQRQPIDMSTVVPTVQFREANPSEWTGADFPSLSSSDLAAQSSSQLDQQSLNDFRSGLRSALQDSHRMLNTKPSNQKRSMAQIAGSFAPVQLSPAEEFPPLCERLGNNNRSNFNESWAPPPQPSQPRRNQFSVPPKTDSTTDFPTLVNEEPKKKNKKSPAMVDFSDLSTARRADQIQPLSASAQRILSGQSHKEKKPSNDPKPEKKQMPVAKIQHTAGPSSSVQQVSLPQRMQRRGERAYFVDNDEPIRMDNFQRIVRVTAEEAPVSKEPKKPVNFTKSEFPSLSAQPVNVKKKQKKQQKPKVEAQESNGIGKQIDPEAHSLAKVQYFVCPNFAERTENLVKNLKEFFDDCGSTKSAFTTYTEISKQYLDGNLNAEAYLLLLRGMQDELKVSGSEKWKKVRIEAIAESINLLPNVARQRALLRTLKESVIDANWFLQVADLLCVCKSCKQVCLKNESKKHQQEAGHSN